MLQNLMSDNKRKQHRREETMSKYLVVVDMQNDFVEGTLGTDAARKIVPSVIKKIKDFPGQVIYTKDTHGSDYLFT